MTSSITFRVATADDALCLGMLGTQVFLDTYATEGIRPALAREVLHHFSTDATALLLADPAVTVVVAERDSHLVGFASIICPAQKPGIPAASGAELRRLYVQARFAGQGLGGRLLDQAEIVARDRGAPTLWLTTWVGNERALRFYPRQGYADAGETVYEFEGESYANRVFAKALPPARS
jgi:GNAT superfamily N-acetyltransferase